jgi:hypothetical protein
MMDRSFLSDQGIVAKSRDFVCIRLATYESASEAKILSSLFQSRSGLLENTVFAVLAPDGTTKLAPAGRSPREAFGTPDEGVRKMGDFLAKYPGKAPVGGDLPCLVDLRRGMNVAACELQPLIGVVARTEEARTRIEQALLPLAWSKEFAGKFDYVRAKSPAEAAEYVDGRLEGDGIFVVQPDAFGTKGRLLAFVPGSDREAMSKGMAKGFAAFAPEAKDSRRHIDDGVRKGLNWKTEIPVTDPMSPKR